MLMTPQTPFSVPNGLRVVAWVSATCHRTAPADLLLVAATGVDLAALAILDQAGGADGHLGLARGDATVACSRVPWRRSAVQWLECEAAA